MQVRRYRSKTLTERVHVHQLVFINESDVRGNRLCELGVKFTTYALYSDCDVFWQKKSGLEATRPCCHADNYLTRERSALLPSRSGDPQAGSGRGQVVSSSAASVIGV
jgi:hypothetical protein